MIDTWREVSVRLPSTACGPQRHPSAVDKYCADNALPLPMLHRELLAMADGISGYGGYYRLFGSGESESTGVATWNDPQVWKFAWRHPLASYIMFGETAWGDQYAYQADALLAGSDRVVVFDGIAMRPMLEFDSFADFINEEFLAVCEEPYDTFDIQVREAVGDLGWDDHVTFSPSVLISGEEKIEHVLRMPAVTAMIVNGDLEAQLADELQSRRLDGLEPYIDELGRSRVRVLWS